MADLIVSSKKEPDADGSVVKVTPESAGWEYVGFEVFRLGTGRTLEWDTGNEEVCLVVLSGRCRVSAGQDEWEDVGERESPFDGPPYAVYLPPGTHYRVEAEIAGKKEQQHLAETAASWLAVLRERVAEVEADTEEARAMRRELVRLLVETVEVDRTEEGKTRVRITYRFGPPSPPGPQNGKSHDENVHVINNSLRLENPMTQSSEIAFSDN